MTRKKRMLDTSLWEKEKKVGQYVSVDFEIVSHYIGSRLIHCSKCLSQRKFKLRSFGWLDFASLSHRAIVICLKCGHEQDVIFSENDLYPDIS